MAFCWPGPKAGADRPPPSRCASLWRERLLAVLPNVALTLLLGGPAQAWARRSAARPSMDATVRAWRTFLPHVWVGPHPSWRNNAWLAKNGRFEREAVAWLRSGVEALLQPCAR